MSEITRIILNGYLGRMGTAIIELADSDAGCEIVAGVDVKQGIVSYPFPTYLNISECDMPADVIVDFTIADAVPATLEYSVRKEIPIVICTTGLSEECVNDLKEISTKTAIFYSGNMSIGINLLENIISRVAGMLNEAGFDIEIIEKHHSQKLDAPSGTALMLANAANFALNDEMQIVSDRTQRREKRSPKEIGIHSIRGGTIVGEHQVIFAGKDEIIEMSHTIHSRSVFAVGAMKAAKFMKGKPPGMYDMGDIFSDSMNEL